MHWKECCHDGGGFPFYFLFPPGFRLVVFDTDIVFVCLRVVDQASGDIALVL